ncbi:methyltransferase [Enterobacter vonholyi]|uniref:methyltransferase n=1 Tax=Enterobacter vonholyi TaxID=2797505 RepID=UPI00207667B6|nr:methyltransferase [Enterobacter vonholyi]MCM7619528.1 methyltransferase [Enterobacter vonholyi]MEB7623306.1 methyltransferase [Enterobacter vonholyi]
MSQRNSLDLLSRKEGMCLLEQSMGFVWQAALRAVAVLGVADRLVEGKKTVTQLAEELNVDGDYLHRIMRLLSSRGVFNELSDAEYSLSQSAQFLCSEHEFSLRAAVLMLTDQTFWQPAAKMDEILQGKPVFNELFGKPFYEYWQHDDSGADSNIFHAGMASMSSVENEAIADSYSFPQNAVVADIAGGLGNLLLAVLRRNPTLKGILFDQKDVLERNRLHLLNDNRRWETVNGSFFEACPVADIYLLKYILMDWPDEKAIQILQCCRNAMKENSRLLIFEPLIKKENNEQGRFEIDLLLLTSFDGGRARTESEYQTLFEKTRLKLNKIIDTRSYLSILEVVPV